MISFHSPSLLDAEKIKHNITVFLHYFYFFLSSDEMAGKPLCLPLGGKHEVTSSCYAPSSTRWQSMPGGH